MKVIQFREPGPPDVLRCLDIPIPEPKPGGVLIRAHAIGVGIPDCLIRAGTYGHMPPLPAEAADFRLYAREAMNVSLTVKDVS
jgi:NADPH:quinone reductase